MARLQLQLIAMALVLSACAPVPLTSARSAKVEYCDKNSDYEVKVSGVEITPYPVRGGKPATLNIRASTDRPISEGNLVIDVYYIGMHVHTDKQGICSATSCPISAGDFTISFSQDLPGYTPPGNYKLRMSMVDGKNHQLTCINFAFSIVWAADSVAES